MVGDQVKTILMVPDCSLLRTAAWLGLGLGLGPGLGLGLGSGLGFGFGLAATL